MTDRGLAASFHRLQEARAAGAAAPDTNALLQQVVDKLAALPSQLRQSTADQLWAAIPSYVTEQAFSDAQAADAPLQAAAATGGLELITAVIVSVPDAATVQLGSLRTYVPAGVTVIAPVSILLQTTDVRSVTCKTAGSVSLILTGVQQPTYGVMR